MITQRKHGEASAEGRAAGRQAPDDGRLGRTCAVGGGRTRGPRGAASPSPRPRPGLRVGPFIPHPAPAAAPRSCRGREGSSGAQRPAPGHNPRPEPRPRRDSRPRVNRTCRGPHRSRVRPEARSPALYRAAVRPPLQRPHRPGVPVVRRSEAAGSLPGAPSSEPDFLAAEARPFSAMPRASQRLPREAYVRAAWRAGGGEQSQRPEARLGGYLDDPAGQPGHLVRSRVRPLLLSPAPLASRTSGSPGLHFRGTSPRPPSLPPPRPLGKCSPCLGHGLQTAFPPTWRPPPPRSPPQPQPGVAEVTLRGGAGTLGEAARGGAELLRPRQNLHDWASGVHERCTCDHACVGGRRNKGPAPDAAHSFIRSVCSFNVPALRVAGWRCRSSLRTRRAARSS